MTTAEIWLGIILLLSIFVNVVLTWLTILQSRKLLYTSENLNDLTEIISSYSKHLKQVYSMEMFYGEENLQFLLEHTKILSKMLEESFSDITYLTEPVEIEETEEEEYAEEEEAEQQEKDVFYGGTRTGNS